jgi:hypothetical protein
VTGLGTPVANDLVPDLVAYQGPGTSYSGPTVGPLQDAGLVNTGASSSGPIDVFSVFDSITVTSDGPGHARGRGIGVELNAPSDTTGAPGATSQTAAGYDPVTSHLNIPVAAASTSGGGMMPLDSTTVRDAVLTDWSSSPGAATKVVREGTRRGPGIRIVTVPGPALARRPVLDVASLEVLFGDEQIAGSLLNDDRWISPRTGHRQSSPGQRPGN